MICSNCDWGILAAYHEPAVEDVAAKAGFLFDTSGNGDIQHLQLGAAVIGAEGKERSCPQAGQYAEHTVYGTQIVQDDVTEPAEIPSAYHRRCAGRIDQEFDTGTVVAGD